MNEEPTGRNAIIAAVRNEFDDDHRARFDALDADTQWRFAQKVLGIRTTAATITPDDFSALAQFAKAVEQLVASIAEAANTFAAIGAMIQFDRRYQRQRRRKLRRVKARG